MTEAQQEAVIAFLKTLRDSEYWRGWVATEAKHLLGWIDPDSEEE